ncbi:uncharacterized protein LOC117540887 isoform X2 [Gymnodraco acuticeps]|uniref:Uncharacterized protein LOC117540887 isoform X2 n=1 Tax=Gymnodraco acuticeps TaxID=8218 RepID=A0A6P8TI99_GYMAC|nr:uncharacterized protein LOC117540887 isoform X2 [Gymnodraco acuticeps]
MKSFVIVLFVVYRLYLCESQGISAGTVFVLKGEDLHLNVTKAVVLGKLDFFSWQYNESNIVRFNSTDKKVYDNHTGRLEFPGNNYSVILKNLQEADSGEYTAVVTKLSGGETEAAKYKIKVQDRASLPLLTVSSVSRNSSSCSFTVTCSSQDSHINSTFTCDNQTCSQEGGERSEGIPDTFLQVHQSRGSIICNHSNHVSWTNTTKIIKDVCYQHVDRASLPLLTVSSVSDSSSSCSFTVTCSSQDSHINSTFTCDNQTCSQEGGERSEGIPDTFLQVHQLSGSIICNHSNHVSWTNTTKIIKDVCYQHVDPQATTILLITLGVCFAILAIIGVLWYLLKRRTSKGASIENPVNDSAQREVLLLTLPVQQDLQPIRPNNTTDNPVLNVSTSSAPVDCKRSGG